MELVLISQDQSLIAEFQQVMNEEKKSPTSYIGSVHVDSDVARTAERWHMSDEINGEYHSLLYLKFYVHCDGRKFMEPVKNLGDIINEINNCIEYYEREINCIEEDEEDEEDDQ